MSSDLTVKKTAELGNFLIKAAADDIREGIQIKAMGHVRDLLLKKEANEAQIEFWQKELRLTDSKLAAIRAGAFKFEKTGVLIFNDPGLNV